MYNRSNQRINYFSYISRKKFQSPVSPFYFGYGRTALKVGLLSYNIPNGKSVLVPNYICGDALKPFHELEIGIKYYSVLDDLSPDWNSIKENLSKDCFAIMMVHYFGIPQNIEKFSLFSNQHNLLLIEDNSHGYGGLYKDRLLGTFGHLGIASPRKSYPILNGGVLFWNNKNDLTKNIDFKLEPANIFKLIVKDIIGRILDHVVAIKKIFLRKLEIPADINTIINDWSIDKASYNLLKKYDVRKVCKTRTDIYQIWERWCKANNLFPIFSLDEKSFAPLAMPLIFDKKNDRDKWLDIFKRNHIAVYIWPDLPKVLLDLPNSGLNLRDRTLCLPIHLSMPPDQLEDFLYKKFNSE